MASVRFVRKVAVLTVAGGCIFQVNGCLSPSAPIFLSVVESAVYQALLQTLLYPFGP